MKDKKTVLKDKSFAFALRCVNLYKYLSETKREFILSKQMLRSGTSVGANIREAQNAESTADYIHKFSISQKECDETIYWLELLYESKYLTLLEFTSINMEANELFKMIRSTILTLKQKSKTL